MAVTKIETVIVASLVGVVAFVAIGAIALTWSENKAKNDSAIAAGFVDFSEMEVAKKNGIDDPTKWRAKVETDKRAREQAEKERQAKAERDAKDDAVRRAKEASEMAERNRPATDRMTISNQSWEIGGFGTVGIMSMSISNKNAFGVRDITISCTFNGKSGTQLSELVHTIYDTIPANSTKTFSKMNVGIINSQSARAGCSLMSAAKG